MTTLQTLTKDLTRNVDTTPLYAALGVTDLAVEAVRDARVRADERAAKVRADLQPQAVQHRAAELATQARELPALALNQGLTLTGKVVEGYEELAKRGESLATRIRNQKATKDLVAQAESTVALGKGAVTTARKAVDDVERTAKATVTTGRKEATRAAEAIASSVQDEAKVAADEVKKSAARTRTAAKRTSTTAKNATKRTSTSAKATRTSARKTANASKTAAKKAAEKVGD